MGEGKGVRGGKKRGTLKQRIGFTNRVPGVGNPDQFFPVVKDRYGTGTEGLGSDMRRLNVDVDLRKDTILRGRSWCLRDGTRTRISTGLYS